jgi:UDP-N-acetylglucosamine 2-epimerase (non-hydrolysing)
MPEEINRLVTDAISDYFFTTSRDADENLLQEGQPTEKIFMVGNLMIDSLVANLGKAAKTELSFTLLNKKEQIAFGRQFLQNQYGVMTFHRPNNVDKKESLARLIDIWGKVSQAIPLVFPVHPRTYKNIQAFGLQDKINAFPQLYFIAPLGYLQFINLVQHAAFVLTDSGGIQEETTYLNISCLTVRPTTERPITIWEGSNKLIKVDEIIPEVDVILKGKGKKGNIPLYWDGKTAERMIKIINNLF